MKNKALRCNFRGGLHPPLPYYNFQTSMSEIRLFTEIERDGTESVNIAETLENVFD